MGSKRTGNPFNRTAFLYNCPFCIEVIHIFRPVFNGRIAQLCIFLHIKLHASGMKIGYVIFRSRTSFDEMQACTFIHDNQGMLKLSCTFGIQTEIGLQRNGYLHSLRHINKGTAGPHCSMQCCKLVIPWCHQLHKILTHHIRIFTGQCTLHIGIDNTLCSDFLTNIVINQLGIILGTHTG